MKNSCRAALVASWVGFLAPCVPTLWGNVGGGSGISLTPYSDPRTVTVAEIEQIKALSSGLRTVEVPVAGMDYPIAVWKAGLVRIKPDGTRGPLMHQFSGLDKGGELRAVDFSEVKTFKILGRDREKLNLEITAFPCITPSDLLKEQPTYSELEKRYSKTVLLSVQVASAEGRLSIVGTIWGKDVKPIPLDEIKVGVPMTFRFISSDKVGGHGEPIWFGTKSVIDDLAYPYRLTAKH